MKKPNQKIIRQPAQTRICRSMFLRAVCFIILLSTLCLRAWGQYAIGWFTIDGGGGTSTGGVYSVSGTIGQPDAGKMSGGNFTIDGGFWGFIAAVQTPGAPLLSITRSTTNSVIVAWPTPATGFVLQQNSALVTMNWMDVTNAPVIVGSEKQVIATPPMGNRFYRLFKP